MPGGEIPRLRIRLLKIALVITIQDLSRKITGFGTLPLMDRAIRNFTSNQLENTLESKARCINLYSFTESLPRGKWDIVYFDRTALPV